METTSGAEPAIPQIERLSHTRLAECYQCGKCTAGCPLAGHMDMPPTRLDAAAATRRHRSALRANSIWQCVSCQTCTTRCPKSVDCAAVMDALRQLAFERGTASPDERRTVLFQKAFLDNIRRNGRLNEIELIAAFKGAVFLRDRSLPFLFRDAGLAPQLQKRRKLHLMGEKAKDRGVVARIFARAGMEAPNEPRLLSRMRAARLFERLRAVAARVPRRAGRDARRNRRLDLLRRHFGALAEPQAGHRAARAQPGAGPAAGPRRDARAVPHVLHAIAAGRAGDGGGPRGCGTRCRPWWRPKWTAARAC